MSNILVINYSLSGTTGQVARDVALSLRADVAQIRDTEKRSGIAGFITSGLEAMAKGLPTILLDSNPRKYDVVVLGTPVWAGTMASPMRSFLHEHGRDLKQVAVFCTMNDSGADKTLREMSALCGSLHAPSFAASRSEIAQSRHLEPLEDFIRQVRGLAGKEMPVAV